MKTIDRLGFGRGILFAAAAVAPGVALSPGAASAMPFDDRVPGALDGWMEKAQAVVVGSGPSRRNKPPPSPPRLRLALGVAEGRKFYSLASNL